MSDAWTLDLSERFEAAMTLAGVSAVVKPDNLLLSLVTAVPRMLSGLLPPAAQPVAGPLLDALDALLGRVSVTVPVPGTDPAIVLSLASQADPVTASCTLLHERTHADQTRRVGGAQAAADYTSVELRAQREADGAAASLWLRHALTGELPADPPPLSSLYHLDADGQRLAAGVLASHLATVRAGCVPPIAACLDAARWLRASPVVPESIKARVPAFVVT